MNPLIKLWQFSLWLLFASVSIICAPFSLLISGTMALAIGLARHRAARRHARYSWSYHQPGRMRRSGYRRARHGIFS